MTGSTHLPLEGLRVLDLTRILSGPYCTLILRDLGAEVIKVERPGVGDDTRWWGPPFLDGGDGISSYFAAMNRGKLSVAIDITKPKGLELIVDLAADCDVVVENFRPGASSRLGITHEVLSAVNKRIVTCSITGFARSSAHAGLPASEIVVEAMAGLMHVTGPRDGEPVRLGIAMVDIATGLTAAVRILSAVMLARSTGQGAHVECSLYSVAMGTLATLVTGYSTSKEEPERWGSHHPSICPYGGFDTADGFLLTGVFNDQSWPRFCEAIELPVLTKSPLYATNASRVDHRDQLEKAITTQTRSRSTAYWLQRLHARKLLAAPIRTVGEAVNEAVEFQPSLFATLAGHPGVVAPWLHGEDGLSGAQKVPRLGQDSVQVLTSYLDKAPDEVRQLVADGIVSADLEA